MPVNITDVDVFTDPVQAPADGDSANGVTFQLTPQHLANRTRNLKNRLDGLPAANNTWAGTNTFNGLVKLTSGYIDNSLGVDGEMLYVDGTTGTPTAVSRTAVVPVSDGEGSGAYDYATAAVLFSGIGFRAYPLDVPRGATITGAVAGFNNTTGGALTLTIDLVRVTPNFSTGAAPSKASVDDANTGSVSAGNSAVATLSGLTEVVDNALHEYQLLIGAGGGQLTALRLTYLDPGPRNG